MMRIGRPCRNSVGVCGVSFFSPLRRACGRDEDWAGLLVIRFAIRDEGERWETIIAEEVLGIYERHVFASARFERAVGCEVRHCGRKVSCI